MPPGVLCPHCGTAALADETELGLLCHCPACDLDWAETLMLDFHTD